jgi:hypothetical protein
MFTGDQLEDFGQFSTNLTSSKMMSKLNGQVAPMKLPTRKANIIGYNKSYCGVHNDPNWSSKMKNKLEFA